MAALDVLKDLQDRVTALEQQLGDQPGVDTLQPNVLTVGPNGEVGAAFTGSVSARGIVFPISEQNQPASTVQWLNAGGAAIAELQAYESGDPPTDQLRFTAWASEGYAEADLEAITGAPGDLDVMLRVLAGKDTLYSNPPGQILAQVGNAWASIVGSDGSSSFLQLLSPQRLALAFGAVNIPAGGSVVVDHNIGRVPQFALATYAGATPPNTALYAAGFTATQLTLGGAPWGVYWLAIG